MWDVASDVERRAAAARDTVGAPARVDRATFQAERDALRAREKAHTHEGDAIAAARRRLPMVEVGAGQHPYRTNGRSIAQWSRLAAGRSNDLSNATR